MLWTVCLQRMPCSVCKFLPAVPLFYYKALVLAFPTAMNILSGSQLLRALRPYNSRHMGSLCMLAIVFVMTGVMVGCQSTGTSHRVSPESIADQFLPREREAEAHPDSMRLLSIVERDDQFAFDMEHSYQQLHRLWSSTFNLLSAGRSPLRPLTYATLWSQELSLASLEARERISTLTKEVARKRIDAERDTYRNTVQIDLYWFSRSRQTPPALLRSSVQIQPIDSNGERYRPTEIRHLPLRDAVLSSGESVIYRRTILVFDRVVDDRDILADTDGLQLHVLTPGVRRLVFAWSWPNEGTETTALR